MMFKRYAIFFVVLVIGLSLAGCGGTSENTGAANSNTAENPFANITDASQALAEGNRLLDEDQIDMAVQAFQQAVKLDPDLAEGWFKLGIAHSLLEMAAQQSGDKVIGESDSKAKPNSQKAFEKAVEAYKKWLDANPNDDAAWFNLGRAYAKLLKDEEAEKAFRQAVKLKPDDVEYLTELGAILIRLAQYHEALDPLKKAVELDPENVHAQELLEDAEAGRQRLDYVAPKNTNSAPANANSNTNSASNSNSNTSSRPANTLKRFESNTKVQPPVNRPRQP
jgi:cytochrome c-type biogenesis protein CcmH/NrfG